MLHILWKNLPVPEDPDPEFGVAGGGAASGECVMF